MEFAGTKSLVNENDLVRFMPTGEICEVIDIGILGNKFSWKFLYTLKNETEEQFQTLENNLEKID